MSETTEGEGTDEGESVQFNSYDGLANLFASPAPSTTGTIDSREEVRYCDEWDLFAAAALDQHEASDSENSTDDHSDDENDEPGTRCVDNELQQTATNITSNSGVVLKRSQQDDTDRPANDDAEHVFPSPFCAAAASTDNNDNHPLGKPISRCEESADTDVHRGIQVVVRVRPPFNAEGKVVVTVGEEEGTSLCVQATSQGSNSTVTECTFDRVFMGGATQEGVFAAVEPSVQACLEGYNATVFTYGQTGTGKTHTLFGRDLDTTQGESDSFRTVKSTWGIVPRTLNYLLDQAAILKQKNYQVELHLSFLQIYNDRLFDLLTDRMRQKPLLIREQPTLEGTTSVIVRGLSSEKITSFSNAMQIIHQGHTNRCVRETESNLSSSRSHAIVQLNVTTQCPATNGEGQVLRRARLNLVDLAGSEKWNADVGIDDAHSQELKNINTSLSALGNCIAALTETGRKHIPYRDSTLTRVLQDSFGGNTQSCLIATINATQQACDETIRTLQFADRARSVMQTIRVNEVVDGSTELLMAKIQIVKLRERLESEQRRRHETRLKEHQTMQRDFQEILKGKDKEITKLTRDNVVFQRWREEDVKKIRALETRVKDLEQQMDTSDSKSIEPSTAASSTVTQGPKRQSSSIPAVKHTPVRKTRSRTNLTRARSDNGGKQQVLERYALGSNRDQQERSAQIRNTAFNQSDPAYDEDPTGAQPAPEISSPMDQKPSWKAPDVNSPDVTRYRYHIYPAIHRPNEDPVPTKNSWTYSSPATNLGTEWTSSIQASKSTPTILIQQQESINKRVNPSPVNGYSSAVPRQEAVSLVKNASTGSFSYNSPPIVSSAIVPCPKHKLAGCMLCTVAPARQPTKERTTSSMVSKSPKVTRNAPDGPCERHQLLRCFICMKGSSSGQVTAVSSPSTASVPCFTYSVPTNSVSAISYHKPQLQGEIQSKCALHSLANCILCAGVKAITRKVVVPTPVKVVAPFDARSANLIDERNSDRYRRYTLDERILNYQTQPKLANQW
ncbi:hypothetical protein PI124_g917 [Phytophthora idaei]|nr:hypothetical protein PI125_g5578 [Phytophthora idaei]KAG3173973.1 hypothetical protein PI126_g601 [Phytophthora idaei]KAG3254517.1 hypothetical protein PI124_g917 [Phytophthora idaei]